MLASVAKTAGSILLDCLSIIMELHNVSAQITILDVNPHHTEFLFPSKAAVLFVRCIS